MKVVSIVQARMGSSRLPGKVMQLIGGKPMIGQVFNQISFSKNVDEIILATTNKSIDDVLEEYVSSIGYRVFRGSEHNVMSRYHDAALFSGADIIVRNTGDNPLIDPTIIDDVIQSFDLENYDYISNNIKRSYPRGCDVEVMTFPSLKKAISKARDKEYLEHVTLYHKAHLDEFNCKNIIAPNEFKRPNMRLTIDTNKDFKAVSEIYKALSKSDSFISIKDVIDLIDMKPEIAQINVDVAQTKIFGKCY
jgi:spore coat polysaccharide biosynthesis protein SpsF